MDRYSILLEKKFKYAVTDKDKLIPNSGTKFCGECTYLKTEKQGFERHNHWCINYRHGLVHGEHHPHILQLIKCVEDDARKMSE